MARREDLVASRTMDAIAPAIECSPKGENRTIALEIAAVLGAFYIPNLIRSVDSYISRLPPDLSHNLLGSALPISLRLGEALLIVYLAWRAGKGLACFGFTKPRILDIFFGLLVFGALLAAMRACDSFQVFLDRIPGARVSSPFYRGMGPVGLAIYFVVGVFFEEVIYRAYLCTRLKDLGWSSGWVVLATSILFAVPHVFQGWGVLPATFLFGLILGIVFMRARTIWPGYIGHLAYDLSLLALYLLNHGPG